MEDQYGRPFGRRDVLRASAGVSGLGVLSKEVIGAKQTPVTDGARAEYELTSTGNGNTRRRSITSEVIGVHRDKEQVTLSTSFLKDSTVVSSDTRQFRIGNLYLSPSGGRQMNKRFTPLVAPQGTAITEDGVLQRLVDPSGERKTVLRLEESQKVNNETEDTSLWLVPMLSPVFAESG